MEVIGVDHIFVSVGDLLGRSEEFYDRVTAILGFRKGEGTIGGDPHLFCYNRQFAYSLRLTADPTGVTFFRPRGGTEHGGEGVEQGEGEPSYTVSPESCFLPTRVNLSLDLYKFVVI